MKKINQQLQGTKFKVEKRQGGYVVYEGCVPYSAGLYTLASVVWYLGTQWVEVCL